MTDDEFDAHLGQAHPHLTGPWPRPTDAHRAHDRDHGWNRPGDPWHGHVHAATTAWAYGGPPRPPRRR